MLSCHCNCGCVGEALFCVGAHTRAAYTVAAVIERLHCTADPSVIYSSCKMVKASLQQVRCRQEG